MYIKALEKKFSRAFLSECESKALAFISERSSPFSSADFVRDPDWFSTPKIVVGGAFFLQRAKTPANQWF